MIPRLLGILALCALNPVNVSAATKLDLILPEGGGRERLEEAGEEARQWLDQAGFKGTLRIGSADAAGWSEEVASWIDTVREGDALETYAVVAEPGDNRISLITRSERGYLPAIYGALYDLGFRWYLPGDKWTVIPQSVDLRDLQSRVVAPDFVSRTFFGTGGFGPRNLAPDPDIEIQAAWRDWQRRNRWGGEVKRVGHAGDSIISQHREVFEQHPEWRAHVDGKPIDISKHRTFHFNHGNPRFQEWYAAERLDWLRRAIERKPDTLVVSADPADGEHPHDESPESMALGDGSVSDRVFTLANVTARAIAEEFPDRWVGINAYNRHLNVPSIPLEPNIYVQVIPYAFNRTGLEAEELIEAWGEKHPGKIGIYDYWNITDWARSEPHLRLLETVPERIRYWKDNGFSDVALESSASIGAMGLPFIVASRMLWDTGEDPDAILDEFFAGMFGPAEPPIRRMIDRWKGGFLLTPQEIALSYRDLEEAMRLAKGTPEIEARLRDFIGYVYFLQRKLEFEEAWSEDPDDLEPALRFAEAIWAIHPGMMAQSYRMHQLIGFRYYRGRFNETVFAEWHPNDPDSRGWQRYQPLDASDLDRILHEGLAAYPVLYAPSTFALEDFVPIMTPTVSPPEQPEIPIRFGGRSRFVFRQTGAEWLEIQNAAKDDLPIRVIVRPVGSDAAGSRIEIPPGDWTKVPIPSEPGLYEILLRPMASFYHRIRSTPGALLTELDSAHVRQPRTELTFYVPRGQKRIALHTPAPAPDGIELFDTDGNSVPTKGRFLRTADVPPGQDGGMWRLRGHAGSRVKRIVYLNGPRVYSFSPHGMLVPGSARAD